MAQSVGHPTSAQLMISWSLSSSPVPGSVLTVQSLEPASDSVCVCLSLSAPTQLVLCLSQKYTIKKYQKEKKAISTQTVRGTASHVAVASLAAYRSHFEMPGDGTRTPHSVCLKVLRAPSGVIKAQKPTFGVPASFRAWAELHAATCKPRDRNVTSSFSSYCWTSSNNSLFALRV